MIVSACSRTFRMSERTLLLHPHPPMPPQHKHLHMHPALKKTQISYGRSLSSWLVQNFLSRCIGCGMATKRSRTQSTIGFSEVMIGRPCPVLNVRIRCGLSKSYIRHIDVILSGKKQLCTRFGFLFRDILRWLHSLHRPSFHFGKGMHRCCNSAKRCGVDFYRKHAI